MKKEKTKETVTIKDIAKMCDVSIATVSNVLNGKTNKVSEDVAAKIKGAVEQTGYKPNFLAKGLRAVSTKTIGVIVEDLIVFSSPSMIEGLMKCSEEHGYDVVIENMRLNGRWHGAWMHDNKLYEEALGMVLKKMDSLNTDGILYLGGHEHIVSGVKSSKNLPIVMAYSMTKDEGIPIFRLDDEKGGYEAIKYLMKKGHKKIGILAGEIDNSHTINRMVGIQKAFYEEGELFNPDLAVYGEWNFEGGFEGMKKILNQDKDITAVFCMSDAIAAGAYEAIKKAGLMPGEKISVLGYDNQEIASYIHPKLSTMALPLEEIGYRAAARLIDMCENPEEYKGSKEEMDTKIPCTLIERESVVKI